MLSTLLLVFVFVAFAMVFILALLGALFFRKKSVQQNKPIDLKNVIDVISKDVE